MNASDTTLIRFDRPPIAAACQPGLIEFDNVSHEQANIRELESIKESSTQEIVPEDKIINTMIRAKPIAKKGTVKCSFTLSGGSEVQTTFELIENIARPLIVFKSVQDKVIANNQDQSMDLLRSLMEEKPMSLHNLTKDYQDCESNTSGVKTCSNHTFETETGTFEIIYVGKNSLVSAWIVKCKLKKNVNFRDISDFKTKSGEIKFSLTLPQQKDFKKGDVVKHHILASPDLGKKELEDLL
jgi:hypothetical protein